MANPGRIIAGVMVVIAFIVLRIAPNIAHPDSYISQALNALNLTHPFFMVIAALVGFLLIFSGLKA